jgi:hypothetical protein
MDTVMDAQQQIRRSAKLVKTIKPLLAGEDPEIVGVVLAELVAILIAGHAPDIREKVLRLFHSVTDDLVPLAVAELVEAGRAPKEWQDADV